MENITEVHRDGLHNAFTDLTKWDSQYWIAFRSANSHSPSDRGVIKIMSSTDLESWNIDSIIDCRLDLRDPKFLIIDEHRMAVYFGACIYLDGLGMKGTDAVEDRNDRHMITLISETSDGKNWSKPSVISKPGDWLWSSLRIKKEDAIEMDIAPGQEIDEDVVFAASYNAPVTSDLSSSISMHILSDDMPISFSKSPGGITSGSVSLSEPCLFLYKGELFCILRRESMPLFGSLRPMTSMVLNLSEGSKDSLGVSIASPCVRPIPNHDSLILSGRVCSLDGVFSPFTAVFLWEPGSKPRTLQWLPSFGDNGYPGVFVDATELIISYYSEDESCKEYGRIQQSSIYLYRAELKKIEGIS